MKPQQTTDEGGRERRKQQQQDDDDKCVTKLFQCKLKWNVNWKWKWQNYVTVVCSRICSLSTNTTKWLTRGQSFEIQVDKQVELLTSKYQSIQVEHLALLSLLRESYMVPPWCKLWDPIRWEFGVPLVPNWLQFQISRHWSFQHFVGFYPSRCLLVNRK